MVPARVVEVWVEFGVELDRDESVLHRLRGVHESEELAGASQGVVVVGEEEGESVSEGGRGVWVRVLDGEGEVRGERRRGVRGWIVETDRCVVDYGSGARVGYAELARESDDAVSEMGVAEEREVADGEGFECEVDVVIGGDEDWFRYGE